MVQVLNQNYGSSVESEKWFKMLNQLGSLNRVHDSRS